jgi:hypothetical protein
MHPTPATNGDDGHGGPCTNAMEPTNNNATQRTNNVELKSPRGDWTKYMPWRAPGFAPSMNPCGKAGAFKPSSSNGAEVPAGAHQYQNGTSLPALKGDKPVWKAGAAVEVGWAMSANHGGGYHYRVCPAGEEQTEACFQAHVLPFVGDTTTIKHFDGRADVTIPAVTFSTGTNPAGSAWRKNPIPMCNCDVGQGCGAKAGARPSSAAMARAAVHFDDGKTCVAGCGSIGAYSWNCNACSADGASCSVCCDGCTKTTKSGVTYCAAGEVPTPPGPAPPSPSSGTYLCKAQTKQCYAGYGSQTQAACEKSCGSAPSPPGPSRNDMFQPYEIQPGAAQKTPECPTGLQFPNLWDEGYGDGGNCLYPIGPNSPTNCGQFQFSMNDMVRAPTKPGDYIVSWRWDCEHTPQVWNQCADVTVVA